MSKPAKVARYTLPDVVDPETTICYLVPVPADKFHQAAFMGQIKALASAYTWANDADHTALDVAAVWRVIFDNLEKCPMQVQFRQDDICTLQASFDGGDTWTTIFDASTCVTNGVNDGIQQRLDDGTLAGGGQQPGQGDGLPGQCHDYFITLQGNNRWLAPVAVGDGDIITVDTVNGAWWDGDILHQWDCPDGSEFLLGACTGSGVTDAGDPAPTVDHMRLIANLPADSTTPYFDIYNTIYTVPGGVDQGQLWLQANDSDLTDNQGSINLHIQICKGGWLKTFDFADGAQGWSIFGGFGSFSTDHFACHVYDGSGDSGVIRVQYEMNINAHPIGIEFTYTVNDSQGGADLRAWPDNTHTGAPIFDAVDPDDTVHSAHTNRAYFEPVSGDNSKWLLFSGGAFTTTPIFNLLKVTLRGVGTEPTW